MFDSIYIYVPEAQQIIKISEGSGDNLLDEDIEAGYVDYIYYEQYVMDPEMRETDGGMIMLTELFQEKFKCTADAIPHVLDMAYGQESLEYIVLR
jgi:hypothetical protein